MQKLAIFYRVLIWLTLIVTTALQVLSGLGIYMTESASLFDPVWLFVTAGVMVLSTITFFALKHVKWIPLLLAFAAGIAGIVCAVMMMNAFPVVVHPLGNSTGISVWDAIWRHMTLILVPLLLIPLWWQQHQENVAEKQAKQAENTPSYFDLLDESYRMRSLDDDDARKPKPKRSMRGKEND